MQSHRSTKKHTQRDCKHSKALKTFKMVRTLIIFVTIKAEILWVQNILLVSPGKTYLKNKMWKVDFRYSCRKMEVTLNWMRKSDLLMRLYLSSQKWANQNLITPRDSRHWHAELDNWSFCQCHCCIRLTYNATYNDSLTIIAVNIVILGWHSVASKTKGTVL